MLRENRNIYQVARESAGYTQERAAELLNISVESLRAYEGSRRVPPDPTVWNMSELYNLQYLIYQHFKLNTVLGNSIPNVERKDIAQAVLNIIVEFDSLDECKDDLIKIARDGVVDDEERPKFEVILEKIDSMIGALFALKYVKR